MNSWKRNLIIRISIGVGLIVLAVILGFTLKGLTGDEAPIWQVCIYVIAITAPVLSAVIGMIKGTWGFLWGFGLVVFMVMPRALPGTWRGYIYAALWTALTIYLLIDPKQKVSSLEDENDEDGALMVVQQTTNGRYFQIIRYGNELRAYRVGGELRDVDVDLLQSQDDELRPISEKDFSIPMADIQRVRCKKLSNNNAGYDCAAVVKTEKKSYRFAPTYLTTNKAFTSFWRKVNPEKTGYEITHEISSGKYDSKRLKILKKAVKALYVYLAIVSIGWLYLYVPYRLFSILAMLAMPIILSIYCCFRNEASILEEPVDVNKKSLFYPMLISVIALLLRNSIDFNLLDWERLLLISICAFAVIMIILMVCTNEWKEHKITILYMMLFLGVYTVTSVAQINFVFDTSEPICEQAVVTEKDETSLTRGGRLFYITVEVEGEEQTFQVSVDQYDGTEIGDAVTVMTYEGFLGISYAEAV